MPVVSSRGGGGGWGGEGDVEVTTDISDYPLALLSMLQISWQID